LIVLREMLSSAEEKLKDLNDQVESLVAQLQEQTELRKGLEEKLDWEGKERMQHMTKIEEHTKVHEELALKLEEERDERLKSENSLKELYESLSNKEEELKELRESLSNKEQELTDLHNQVLSLTTELQEQITRKKELEDKLDQEREQRMQDAVMVSDRSSENLPVSSMPWTEEKLEFAKLLDEQKTLLANQMLEAEKLKNAAQMKVGLLNHQVRELSTERFFSLLQSPVSASVFTGSTTSLTFIWGF
jgi:chromosome segregation ATPase